MMTQFVFNALFFEGTFLLKESQLVLCDVIYVVENHKIACFACDLSPFWKKNGVGKITSSTLQSVKKEQLMTKLHEIDHPEKKVDKNVVFAHYYMCMATLDSIESWWLPVQSDK